MNLIDKEKVKLIEMDEVQKYRGVVDEYYADGFSDAINKVLALPTVQERKPDNGYDLFPLLTDEDKQQNRWYVQGFEDGMKAQERTGQWQWKYDNKVGRYRCSECYSYALRDDFRKENLSDYCPVCGAKMEEGEPMSQSDKQKETLIQQVMDMADAVMPFTALQPTTQEQKDYVKIPETGIGDLSDGYHTFNGLYEQRMILFAALVKAYRDKAWKSYRHEDGEYCFGGGWFIVGIDTPEGSYTYHYENQYWDMFDCEDLPRAKHWDGHTEEDAETRLMSLEPRRERTGQWINMGDGELWRGYACNRCGRGINYIENFCPQCGTRMEVQDD